MIKSGWLKEALLDNAAYKIISVMLAVVLWIFVVIENQPEVGFIVPITFRNMPKNLTFVGNPRNYDVEVRAKGPQSLINNLSSRQFSLELSLSQSQPGDTYFSVFPQDIRAPRGIRIIRVLPSQIKVVMEPLISRTVPIEPVVLGTPAEGYELRQVNVFPPRVRISGPQSKVEEIKALRTSAVSIAGLNKPLTQKVELVLGENIELAERVSAEVRAIIQEKAENKVFYNVPLQILPPVRGAVIEPKVANLVISGPASTIHSLRVEHLNAFTNLQSLKPGEEQVRVELQLPEKIRLVRIEPASVRVVSRGEEDRLLRPQIGVLH